MAKIEIKLEETTLHFNSANDAAEYLKVFNEWERESERIKSKAFIEKNKPKEGTVKNFNLDATPVEMPKSMFDFGKPPKLQGYEYDFQWKDTAVGNIRLTASCVPVDKSVVTVFDELCVSLKAAKDRITAGAKMQ